MITVIRQVHDGMKAYARSSDRPFDPPVLVVLQGFIEEVDNLADLVHLYE